jgi:hypothetical protein
MFHQTLTIAKALDEHGIILNYDDLQTKRKPKILPTILVSAHYPIADTIPQKQREEMKALGYTDFWEYFVDKQMGWKRKS